MGRAFAVLDTAGGVGLRGSRSSARARSSRPSARAAMFAIAGAGALAVWLLAAVALRGVWNEPTPAVPQRRSAEARPTR